MAMFSRNRLCQTVGHRVSSPCHRLGRPWSPETQPWILSSSGPALILSLLGISVTQHGRLEASGFRQLTVGSLGRSSGTAGPRPDSAQKK